LGFNKINSRKPLMRLKMPKPPYEISKRTWDDYRRVQDSGKMNMFGYPTVVYFMKYQAYEKCLQHFDEEENTEPIIINDD